MILSLNQLPELQSLDETSRSEALRLWRRALMRGWSFYLVDVALRLSVWVVFAIIRFGLLPSIGFRWFDFAWVVVAFWVGQILSVRILYVRRRDLLQAIIEQATPTPNQTMQRTPTRRSPHISHD
jgi:hypothetical protein